MKKIYIVFIFLVIPSLCNSTVLDQKIAESYTKSDYVTVVAIFEQQIKEIISKGEKVNFSDLYRKQLFLAYIYAWKLDKTAEALKVYEKIAELRKSTEEIKASPPIEFLFIAEIYERKEDYSKARGYYQDFLKGLITIQEKENDDVSILVAEELIRFTKYQIDGINLKSEVLGKSSPLLPRLKLSSTHSSIFPFLAFVLAPTAEYDFAIAMKTDPADYIKQSQANLSTRILNYFLVLNISAGSVDESSERALEAYITKYPEGYHSLLLRYMFYKFYRENGMDEKAERLFKEIKEIERKRKIELIIAPDKRFSSPEETWKTYREALIEGDIDTAMECYVPGRWKHKKIYTALGKEKLKEIAGRMGEIQRITGNEQSAKYRTRKMEHGKEITYYIYFHNIDGEWKMEEF